MNFRMTNHQMLVLENWIIEHDAHNVNANLSICEAAIQAATALGFPVSTPAYYRRRMFLKEADYTLLHRGYRTPVKTLSHYKRFRQVDLWEFMDVIVEILKKHGPQPLPHLAKLCAQDWRPVTIDALDSLLAIGHRRLRLENGLIYLLHTAETSVANTGQQASADAPYEDSAISS